MAIAGIFGGRLGAMAAASGEVVEHLTSQPEAKNLEQLVERVAADLSQFAVGEGWPQDVLDRAAINVSEILARFPPTAKALARASFDPDLLVQKIEAQSSGVTKTLDPADQEACHRLLRNCVIAVVLNRATLPEVQHEFRRSLHAQLKALETMPSDVVQASARLAALSRLVEPVRPWEPELYPSSALLRAQYAVVPFAGREAELADLRIWAEGEARVGVRLLTGPGGIGKSRLLIEFCDRMNEDGWQAGFLHSGASAPSTVEMIELGRDVTGVAMVIDYAETKRRIVQDAIRAAIQSGSRVRLVLLARHAGDWWSELADTPGEVGDLLYGQATQHVRLGPMATTEEARARAYDAAMDAFGAALRLTLPEEDMGSLEADVFDRILFVHAAALSRILGEPAGTEKSLLDFLLRREQEFLDRAMSEAGLKHLQGAPIRQAAAILTLSGGAASMRDASELMSLAPLLQHEERGILMRVARMLRTYYPSDEWLGGVEPDLLGEHLVARALEHDPTMLDNISG